MPLLVKICGINSREAMDAALDAGADMVGLVFFPKSPRNVTLAQARRLADQARGRADIAALAVDAADIALDDIMDAVRPDWLQLHGTESPERLAHIRRRFGRPVMKAIGVAALSDVARAGVYAAVADRLLIDAKASEGASRPGGNGLAFDWNIVADAAIATPFMLSGGLTPTTVDAAIGQLLSARSFLGVDVSSGVERAPGDKDPARIRAFIAAARAHHAALERDRVA